MHRGALRGGCPDEQRAPPPSEKPHELLEMKVYSAPPRRAESVIAVSAKEWREAVEAGIVTAPPMVEVLPDDDIDSNG